MVLSWYDLDQLPADSCGCGWEWFVGKERVDIGYWKIVKYHLFWRFRRLVGDGSTLFVVEFSEVSSAGVEKVAGRTCWRVSRPTSGWLERFCLGGGNFWTTRNPLWRGILQGTDVFCPFLLLFLLIRFFCVMYKRSLVAAFVFILCAVIVLCSQDNSVCLLLCWGTLVCCRSLSVTTFKVSLLPFRSYLFYAVCWVVLEIVLLTSIWLHSFTHIAQLTFIKSWGYCYGEPEE